MSILILYNSKHGAVKEVVSMMKNISGEQIDIRELDSHISGSDIEKYDSLIVGGSIHMGKVQKRIIRFCKNYSHFFKEKKSGIFLCTLTDPKEAEHYIEENFPADVIKACQAIGLFGGAIHFEKMNFLEKAMMKKITHQDQSFSKIDTDRIAAFIESF
jgi:menaquinone-dependent protoporphyrinogen oxidase